MAASAFHWNAAPMATPPPRPAVLWSIALLAFVAAAVSASVSLTTDELPAPVMRATLWVWIIVSYVGAGLAAWSRRPQSRLGPLMVAAGFAAFFSAVLTSVDVPYTIGVPLRMLPLALFLHLFLAYPTGRLLHWPERIVVLTAYTAGPGVGVVRLAFDDVGQERVLQLTVQPSIADPLLRAQLLIISASALAGVVVLILRRRAAGRPLRRWLDLLIHSFALGLVMIALLHIMATFDLPGHEVVRAGAFVMIGLAPAAFLIGVLRVHLARSAVATLMLDLQQRPAPADLGGALARALGDPSLTVAFWLPEFGTYADLDGRAVELDDGKKSMTPIDRDGSHVAALVHDPALDDERDLLDAVTATAGLAIENGRLDATLRAQVVELRQSRARIVDAGQQERKRLERNLHDGAQQRLIALSLELGRLEAGLHGESDVRTGLDKARVEIATSLEELRDVSRGLHPAVVSGHGLNIALEQLAARAPCRVQLNVQVATRLPESLEVAAFYLVSESLANIGKHASATWASVEISRSDGHIVVEVVDDGVGGADTERGSGLRGLADRVEALEGRLQVWSPVGGGTRLRAELPCAS